RPTNSFPHRCKIIIGGLGPCDTEPEPASPDDPTRNHSQNPSAPNKAVTHNLEAVAPLNTETTSFPPSLVDYSTPPTPAELQEIKAVINKLRPDLAHLPVPETHLCPCGQWIFGDCGCPPCDPSKMN